MIFEKFQVKPDFPWKDYDTYGVFRNTNNRKWFALLMDIEKSKLDKTKVGKTDVINIKLDKEEIQSLIKQNGFYPAYHMNKNNWITIVLDDTLPDDTVMKYISESYGFTKQKKSKQ